MLHKAENVRLEYRRRFWTSNVDVIIAVGRKRYLLGKVKEQVFFERLEAQRHYPNLVTKVSGRHYWQFQNKFYWESDGLRSGEVHALLAMREQRKRRQIDTAQATFAMGSAPRTASGRRAIPDDVKVYVMRRDAGSCRACGSTTELQFDHIIPLAMGGSNEAENLQILCGPCNRSKSAGLTVRR